MSCYDMCYIRLWNRRVQITGTCTGNGRLILFKTIMFCFVLFFMLCYAMLCYIVRLRNSLVKNKGIMLAGKGRLITFKLTMLCYVMLCYAMLSHLC